MSRIDKSLLGTNFIAVVILLVASLWGGMQDDLAQQTAGVISGFIGAALGLRNWYKNAKLTTGKKWIADPNNWTYLSALVAALAPKFADLVPPLKDLFVAISNGNWGSIITTGISFLTLVYYLVLKGNNTKTANVIVLMLIVPALAIAGCDNKSPEVVKAVPLDYHSAEDNLSDGGNYCKAIEVNKPNTKRAVGEFGKYWPGAQPEITVKFLGKNQSRENDFRRAAADWSKYCGVRFVYLASGKANIRVKFDSGDGSWSYIGTDANSVSGASTATLNLGWDGYDVAAHEIGHAIGLLHEQSNPNKGICWNEQAVINALSGPPNYWSVSQIQENVFKKADPSSVSATEFDPGSIMQYNIPGSWTCSGEAIPGGKTISERDQAFISKAYPTANSITITSADRIKIINALDEIKSILSVKTNTSNEKVFHSLPDGH